MRVVLGRKSREEGRSVGLGVEGGECWFLSGDWIRLRLEWEWEWKGSRWKDLLEYLELYEMIGRVRERKKTR